MMGNTSSPLRYAMRHNDVKAVHSILEEAGEGSPDIINEDYTADCILDSCNRNVQTPVHSALFGYKHEILDLLLKYGGDPNSPGGSGETIVHRAAGQNNLFGAKLVLSYGADVHMRDFHGSYPVHNAASSLTSRAKGNVDVLKYLIEEVGKAEDVNLTDNPGNTPLHIAAKKENMAAVKYLLQCGSDINAKNKAGKTPLDVCKVSFGQDITTMMNSLKNKT